MKTFIFQSELWLPQPKAQVFNFFADAGNLQAITPPWLRFEIITPAPITMRAGALIDYRLRVHGFPIRWQTEITDWQPPHRFVDMQRRGPYTLWHHTHTFSELEGGTVCRDEVRYRPLGGSLTNALFVRQDVERIFAFRSEELKRRFPAR